MSDDFSVMYRPINLKELVGQESIIKSLNHLRDTGFPNAFLFHGPSGVGKTTVARIISNWLGCKGSDLLEIDGATNSGVDDVRKIANKSNYTSLNSDNQIVIIDECHRLSGNAWDALLKPIEDTPDNFYWIFCTTNLTKVPKTIKTRCMVYEFAEVSTKDIVSLLLRVVEEEDLDFDEDDLELIASNSDGSPRKSLKLLSQCKSASNTKELKIMLKTAEGSAEIIDFCRFLIFGKPTLKETLNFIRKFKEDISPESVRQVLLSYCTSCLLGNKEFKDPEKVLAIMDVFDSRPCLDNKWTPFLLSIGDLFSLND